MPDRSDLPHEYLYLGAVFLVLHEIRADPLAQAFGFADVDDRPVLVETDIRPVTEAAGPPVLSTRIFLRCPSVAKVAKF